MSNENNNLVLSADEQNQIIEMTNQAMTAASASLGLLFGEDVSLSTPNLTTADSLSLMPEPFAGDAKMLVSIPFSKGIEGNTFLILKNADCRVLSAKMMGSDDGAEGDELTELEIGATGELLSQLYNAATSSLASFMGEAVEVQSPEVTPYSTDTLLTAHAAFETEPLTILEYSFISAGDQHPIPVTEIRLSSAIKATLAKIGAPSSTSEDSEPDTVVTSSTSDDNDEINLSDIIDIDGLMSEITEPVMASVGGGGEKKDSKSVDPVMVHPVEFSSFDNKPNMIGESNANLALVMDVSLSLTVELGKTSLPIKDVLELTRGSVIELQRVAGEAVDLMANGKLIAKGEVVVIEDNFGLRITSIISPEDRLRGL